MNDATTTAITTLAERTVALLEACEFDIGDNGKPYARLPASYTYDLADALAALLVSTGALPSKGRAQ